MIWKRCHNVCIGKTWTAIDKLSTKWKSDLPDKIKLKFFQAVAVSVLLYSCTTWTLRKHLEKNLGENCFELVLEVAP